MTHVNDQSLCTLYTFMDTMTLMSLHMTRPKKLARISLAVDNPVSPQLCRNFAGSTSYFVGFVVRWLL